MSLFRRCCLPVCSVATILLGGLTADVQAQVEPNIVVFYADDIGIGDITAYRTAGGTTTRSDTPNVDALANDGMLFTDAHSAAGLCAPSRYSLLTGNLPARGQFFAGQFSAGGQFQVRPNQRTIANILQDVGYNTGYVGKVHLGGGYQDADGNPYVARNFRTNREPNPGNQFVDWTRGFQKSVNDIGFNYSFTSHDGIQSTPYIYFENNHAIDRLRFANGRWRWGRATTNRAVVFDRRFVNNNLLGGEIQDVDTGRNNIVGWPYWDSTKTGEVYTQAALNFLRRHRRRGAGTPFYLQFASQAVHIPHTPSDNFFGQPVAGVEETPHLDMIREMDLQVGAIVNELRRTGQLDNTLFIFTSDNGGLRFSRPVGHQTSGIYRSRKGSIHEGGHRVPFIARWFGDNGNPIIPTNSRCEEAVSQMDLFATVADLVDSPQGPDQGLDSSSFLPYLFGDFNTVLRNSLIVSAQDSYALRVVRSGLKIIGSVTRPSVSQSLNGGLAANLVVPRRIDSIFNLRNDISETNDLVNVIDASRRRRLRLLLNRRIQPRPGHPLGRSTLVQDSDGDGLFDYWERRGTGTLADFDGRIFSSNRDRDRDGISDGVEYLLRTDATTPN